MDRLFSFRFFVIFISFCCSVEYVTAQDKKWYVEPRVGYANQDFSWSIAGNENGANPNILSELNWWNLEAVTYGLNIGHQVGKNFHLSLSGYYDQIFAGRGNDADYATDNRTGRFYNLDFISDIGYNYNVNLEAAYVLPQVMGISTKLLLGYDQLGNRLYLLETAGEPTTVGLRSTYETAWYGAKGGVELTYEIGKTSIAGAYRIGLYDYQAVANWNLIEDFEHPVSFRQYALGISHNFDLRLGYQFTKHFAGILSGAYGSSFARPGLDISYGVDGSQPRTRFNEGDFVRTNIILGGRYSF